MRKTQIVLRHLCLGILILSLAFSAAGCSGVIPDSLSGDSAPVISDVESSAVSSAESSASVESSASSSAGSSASSRSESSADSGEFPSANSDVDFGSSVSSGSSSDESSSEPESSEEESESSQEQSQSSATDIPALKPVSGEMRAVWFSYLDLDGMLKGKSLSAFTSNINAAFDNVAALGCNTVIVQVRPFSDALYPSSYFPWSAYASGTQGASPGFDPLAIMVDSAHGRGLRIEAWVNPYRVSTSSDSTKLSAGNPAKKWIDSGSDAVVVTSAGIYYNPAREDARKLIVNGVTEIVSNYNIDGIHFDDYFYPNPDKSFDSAAFAEYSGPMTLAEWRRENVNILVREVYNAIKSVNPSVQFGISPQGNMNNNLNSQYIDVAKWLSNSGYVDYIMPQIYFGFDNAGSPYKTVVDQFSSMIKVSGIGLYVGLAPYKVGIEDTWAGTGKSEWINNSDILMRQVQYARGVSSYQGFALFRYNSVFAPGSGVRSQVNTEISNLASILG